MHETLAFLVFASLLTPTNIMIAAGLVLVVVVLGAALFLFRNSGKKKGTAAKTGTGTGADWQRIQGQGQQGMMGQQQAMPGGAWGQQGVGGSADNAWGQQQPGAWGAQTPSQQQQQQPGAWGAQTPSQQQQQPGAWGAQTPSQQQQQPGAWGAQMPNQQQPGAWGAQTPSQQLHQPNPWETQLAGQSQQQQPDAWSGQSSAQQQPNPWETQLSGQSQQPGAWGAQPSAQQQPAANSWGTPSPAQQQQPSSPWSNATPNTPSGNTGAGGNANWDATSVPQQPVTTGQDAWNQSQSSMQQSGTPVWGMQNNPPAQQQAPTAYGGNNASNSWGQAAPAQQNNWGQAQSVPPSTDSWGQSNPAQQQQPAGWGAGASPFQQPSTTGGNAMTPAWQQPQQPQQPQQGQQVLGANAPGIGAYGQPFANNDADKTMLRPPSPQGSLGIVRVEEGKEPGKVYEVRKDELSIGRSRESDIFLEDLAVSRLHAKIVSLGSGNYALKDEGSANGTKVNGQLVNKYQTYPLQEGDRIQLGQTVLVFARR